jgi:hypothetical protein
MMRDLAWAAAAMGDLRRCFAVQGAEQLGERFGSQFWRRSTSCSG